MTTVILASTLYGLATVAAAFDSGLAPRARGRRVLVVANNSQVAEVVPALHELPEFVAFADEFDHVVSLNDLIAPFHPSTWQQGEVNSTLWERAFRQAWGLGDGPLHLVLESVQVRPARTFIDVFRDANISVYADGLMSYGPTRSGIDPSVGARMTDLWYADVIKGLSPLLLREHSVQQRAISIGALRDRLARLNTSPVPTPVDGERRALIVSQYLSSLGLVSHEEETALYRAMVEAAVRAGATSILFKPHPGDVAMLTGSLAAIAEDTGVTIETVESRAPVEALLAELRVHLVVGCFSTALVTSWALFGVRPLAVGTELLLERVRPYWNSNRMPLVIVDALVAQGSSFEQAPGATDEMIETVETVAYLMQPRRLPELEKVARRALVAGSVRPEYLDRDRLAELAMPGADPMRRLVRRAARAKRVRRLAKAVYRGMGATAPTRALRSRLGA